MPSCFRLTLLILVVLLTWPVAVEAYQDAPDFSLPVVDSNGLTGQKVTLSSFRGRGVLLEFMEPWCSHCQNMAPVLETLYQQYQTQNVAFLSVSGPWNGATANDAANFIRTYHASWTYVYDSSGSVFNAYKVTGTPTYFIIGTNGSIIATFLGQVAPETLMPDLAKAMGTTNQNTVAETAWPAILLAAAITLSGVVMRNRKTASP